MATPHDDLSFSIKTSGQTKNSQLDLFSQVLTDSEIEQVEWERERERERGREREREIDDKFYFLLGLLGEN